MSNILTRKELAEELKVNERKIAELEKEGLPVLNLGERTKRYDLEEVRKWFVELNDLAKNIN